MLDNYSNALDSIVNRYDGIIKLFKETVGETNDSAIINTEYLERVKQRMKDPIEGLSKISTRTQSIYSDISDIISLGNPSLDDVNTRPMPKHKRASMIRLRTWRCLITLF